jgi:hypothetical protein
MKFQILQIAEYAKRVFFAFILVYLFLAVFLSPYSSATEAVKLTRGARVFRTLAQTSLKRSMKTFPFQEG